MAAVDNTRPRNYNGAIVNFQGKDLGLWQKVLWK